MNNDFDRTPEELDKENTKPDAPEQNKTGFFKDKRFNIALVAFIVALSLVLSVMTTFTLTKRHYEKKLVQAYLDVLTTGGDDLAELDKFFGKYSYYDLDSEALIERALRAYISATGDKYARYYNKEEYAEFLDTRISISSGIGINIEHSESDGAIRITRVMNGSPAEKNGLKAGDLIVGVILKDGTHAAVSDIGYEAASEALSGEVGYVANFFVRRGGEPLTLEFSIPLERHFRDTVDYRVCSTDTSVGIIMITKFDLLTPKLFKEAMEALKEKGISKIVFDMRDNPGGDLASVMAILSYFRNEGDTLLSVKTRDGAENVYKCTVRAYDDVTYKECEVKAEEIGMYRGLSYAVLINGDTASAAELFASNFRDASLGTLVGKTTFGKGILQTTYPFGEGAVKLTTKAYFPPCGVSYDKIGIAPSEGYDVELSEEAAKINHYIRDDLIDNQLQAAIAALNK